MENENKKIGRPTVMTPEVIQKLEEVFEIGGTDTEACLIAGIGKTAFYNFCQDNPEFVERKEELKQMPKYKARYNINKAIKDGDKSISQWYLERKGKDEFAQRVEQTGKDGKDLIPDKETKDRVDNLLGEILNDNGKIS